MNYDDIIYNTAIKNGFTPTSAKFVVAQSRHETANYTSDVFKRTNNLFGMKFVNQPLAISDNKKSPEGDYYAHYRSAKDSAEDAIGRLFNTTKNGVTPSQLKHAKTPEEYSNLQKKRGYFGDSIEIYISGIKSALNKITISANKNKGKTLILGLGLILLSIYLYNKKK